MQTKMTLSSEQQNIINLIENTNANLFLTGKAGTGKSHVIKYFIENTKKKVVLLAYTGLAASNIGGQTINTFFQIYSDALYDYKEQLAIQEDRDSTYGLKKMLNRLDTIIIDEISMVRSDLLHTINELCKYYRESDLPFGGLQMIFVGDPYQLPPVTKPKELRSILTRKYGGVHFFNAPDVITSMKAYQLTHIFRQDDSVFKDILNNIRVGTNLSNVLTLLNNRVTKPKSMDNVVVITTRNDDVDSYNDKELAKLSTPAYTYDAIIKGKFNDRPTNEHLVLKEGAQIMMLRNDPSGRWYNGSIGTIHRLTKDSIFVNLDGSVYEVDTFTWTNNKYNYDEANDSLSQSYLGSFTQYPIRLAWAVTIHKSQGQTYDSCYVKINHAFDSGQTYVALSRCRTLDNLYLASPLKSRDIIVDPSVRMFMSNINNS